MCGSPLCCWVGPCTGARGPRPHRARHEVRGRSRVNKAVSNIDLSQPNYPNCGLRVAESTFGAATFLNSFVSTTHPQFFINNNSVIVVLLVLLFVYVRCFSTLKRSSLHGGQTLH